MREQKSIKDDKSISFIFVISTKKSSKPKIQIIQNEIIEIKYIKNIFILSEINFDFINLLSSILYVYYKIIKFKKEPFLKSCISLTSS